MGQVLRNGFAALYAPSDKPITLSVTAADVEGNAEERPHVVELPPVVNTNGQGGAQSKNCLARATRAAA